MVEKIGVERSKKALEEANLVLLVLNSSEPLTEQDRTLLEISQNSNRIILLNKTDLPQAIYAVNKLKDLGYTVEKTAEFSQDTLKSIAIFLWKFTAFAESIGWMSPSLSTGKLSNMVALCPTLL